MKPILAALSGQTLKRPPFWLMRQAGRYLPEYMELRGEAGSFLDLVYNPEFAAEVTIQPLRRFGMDAAILFSDILVIPQALGQHLEFVKGEGPKLDPIRSADGVDILEEDSIHDMLSPIYDTVRNVRAGLSKEGFDDTALIGFAGAPWTVACYMVDGGGSKDFAETKRFAYSDPEGFDRMIDILVKSTASYLVEQIKAGAEVIKIFDSWAGICDEQLFDRYVIQPAKAIIDLVRAELKGTEFEDTPVIAFARGAGMRHVDYAKAVGANAIAVDQMTPVSWVSENIQPHVCVQGNLDPYCLLAGGQILDRTVKTILDGLSGGPFIFNLGHGINKETPSEHVAQLSKIIQGDGS